MATEEVNQDCFAGYVKIWLVKPTAAEEVNDTNSAIFF